MSKKKEKSKSTNVLLQDAQIPGVSRLPRNASVVVGSSLIGLGGLTTATLAIYLGVTGPHPTETYLLFVPLGSLLVTGCFLFRAAHWTLFRTSQERDVITRNGLKSSASRDGLGGQAPISPALLKNSVPATTGPVRATY